jgi:hypothetical protein
MIRTVVPAPEMKYLFCSDSLPWMAMKSTKEVLFGAKNEYFISGAGASVNRMICWIPN